MYSPKIKEEHIPVLYRIAQKLKKPMTVIVNKMIAEGLAKHEGEVNEHIAEDSGNGESV